MSSSGAPFPDDADPYTGFCDTLFGDSYDDTLRLPSQFNLDREAEEPHASAPAPAPAPAPATFPNTTNQPSITPHPVAETAEFQHGLHMDTDFNFEWFNSIDYQGLPALAQPAPQLFPASAQPVSQQLLTFPTPAEPPVQGTGHQYPSHNLSTSTVEHSDSAIPDIRVPGKKIDHNRRAKLDPSNDPAELYKKPGPFPNWGPIIKDTTGKKRHTFTYYQGGPELHPGIKLSKEELIQFFLSPPPGSGSQRKEFTIWIQNSPAQVNNRYQSSGGSKCRYNKCPAKNGTILKGFLRVAFDEIPKMTTGGTSDPFHYAGFMHLWCFEDVFDLGFLANYAYDLWKFRVKADNRSLPRETRNPMSITRDHEDLFNVFAVWQERQLARAERKKNHAELLGTPSRDLSLMDAVPARKKKDFLWYTLTDMHLQLEVKGRRETRDRRGGANIDLHRGNLPKFLSLKRAQNKRRREEAELDDDEEGDVADHSTRNAHAHGFSEGATYHPQPPQALLPLQLPQEQLHVLHSQQQSGSPRTRKRSRDMVGCIQQVLAGNQHITRSQAHEIVDLLGDQPQHVREQVLATVPEHAESVLHAAQEPPLLHHDQLEERVTRLAKRQRRDVSGYTEKREAGKDPRKLHSL